MIPPSIYALGIMIPDEHVNYHCSTKLCERFGIRRNTGYTWVRRDTEQDLAGLQEKSRAPHHCPHRMSEEVEAVLLEAKRAHPHWGPRKILP
jgi:putative transposase